MLKTDKRRRYGAFRRHLQSYRGEFRYRKSCRKAFREEGASVAPNARRAEPLDQLVAEIRALGGRAVAIVGDVVDEQTYHRCTDAARNEFSALDVAFNNAGVVGAMKPLAQIEPVETWKRDRDQLDCGLPENAGANPRDVGPRWRLSHLHRKLCRKQSRFGSHAAAKAGLVGLVKGLTADYGERGIRANALLPGGTATAMAGDAAQGGWAAGLHAMKRIAEPEEIARAAKSGRDRVMCSLEGEAAISVGAESQRALEDPVEAVRQTAV